MPLSVSDPAIVTTGNVCCQTTASANLYTAVNMAGRGYDVVVDVDEEVQSRAYTSIFKKYIFLRLRAQRAIWATPTCKRTSSSTHRVRLFLLGKSRLLLTSAQTLKIPKAVAKSRPMKAVRTTLHKGVYTCTDTQRKQADSSPKPPAPPTTAPTNGSSGA
jgi:hypothetical protein